MRSYAAALRFVVVVGILCSLVAWMLFDRSEDRLTEAGFQAASHERLLAIQKQLNESTAALDDLASLYAVSDEVSVEDFTVFVNPILARSPALRGLSWNPVVSREERVSHEMAARASGFEGYQIVEVNESGELVTAPAREQYVVVSAIAPAEGNEGAGFDVYSEPSRREALDQARDTGEVAIAVPINLVRAGRESTGVLMYKPLFQAGASTATVDERRANVVGYFASVVEIGETIGAALANLDPVDIELQILAARADSPPELVYSSDPSLGPASAGLQAETTLVIGGQQLEVIFLEGGSFSNQFRTAAPLGVLFTGLFITFLVAAFFRALQQRATRIERTVAERTADLRKANLGLEAEVDRRTKAEQALEQYRDDLERQVSDRTSELEFTTKQLRAVVDSEPECVKLVSATGELVDMNPAGLRMIEAESIDQVRGLCVYDLVLEADRQSFIDLNERVIAGESATLEFEIEGLLGTRRRMETHAVPLVTADGEPSLHLAITRDITQRAQAERERLGLETQLRHSQKLRSVGVLAGGIAHDFNNLLQVIVGNTEVALKTIKADERTADALERSRAAATEAGKLCDQMLTYAGESRPDVRPVFLPAIVESMLELLEVSHTKKVRLSIEMEEDLGSIEGDDTQLGQVVVNLVTNASEAIGAGTGSVRVTVREVDVDKSLPDDVWFDSEPAPGRYIALAVEDDGPGMSADELEDIFDPFYTTKFAGRGLGLSSTLGIVRSHSGFVNVASELGVGSKFTVIFPVSSEPVHGQGEMMPLESADFSGSVLIVDDQPQILTMLAHFLEDFGLRVLTAGDGEVALQVFFDHEDDIDLAILDVTMPKLDGNETAKVLREHRPDLPIIFCSGYAAEVANDEVGTDGFTGFLHKPYRRADLVSVLEEADDATGWSSEPRTTVGHR